MWSSIKFVMCYYIWGALHFFCGEYFICLDEYCIFLDSITFVYKVLQGSSVYPTLHQEWTLNKHTLQAAVFHQYILINHPVSLHHYQKWTIWEDI